VKLIPLRNSDKYAQVDDSDYDALRLFPWAYHKEGTKNEYAVMRVYPKMFYMHRLIIAGAEIVDHRDSNGLNNQRDNLRPATSRTNTQHRRKFHGKCAHKGVKVEVSRTVIRYRARILSNGVRMDLGLYANPISAAMAYDAAAARHFGEFAHLNFKGSGK
jgi:hypothetical protein